MHVACRRPDVVEFWASTEWRPYTLRFRVFGTGQPIPGGASYAGTAFAADGRLVGQLVSAREGGVAGTSDLP